MKGSAKIMPPKKQPKKSQKSTKVSKKVLNQPQIGSPAFNKLQAQWYGKLKRSGFKDIEGKGGRINGQSMYDTRWHEYLRSNYSPGMHYFRRWSCYLAFNADRLTPTERRTIQMYAEGMTNKEIYPVLRKEFRQSINIVNMHYLLERLRLVIEHWNRTNPNGLDYVSDIDP